MSARAPVPSWLLLAPWFRWAAQGVGGPGMRVRDTRPALQKYATSDPVGMFVKEPQHSLKFLEDEDRYDYANRLTGPRTAPQVRGRLTDFELVTTMTRKLYLDSHRRFYLVVVQLVRDEPGYPCVSRDDVCQQGFVVRRRPFQTDTRMDLKIAQILHGLVTERLPNPHVEQMRQILTTSDSPVSAKYMTQLAAVDSAIAQKLVDGRRQLIAWAHANKTTYAIEGWHPCVHPNIGYWDTVADAPQLLEEETYPLYAMAPDPDDKTHDGCNTSLYFGMVPTGGSDVEDDGTARFDDQTHYEIRCFVRRHDKRCPRSETKVPDCGGELVWSAPSEIYRVAAQMDPTGTANHAITVQAPDIPALMTKAAALGKGSAKAKGGVRIVSPPGSSFQLDPPSLTSGPLPGGGGFGGAAGEVCTFMIPVFTIVALFLFNVFLPILMLIMQAWWLLALKLCLPPSAGADVSANLQTESKDLEDNFSVHVTATADLDSQFASPAKNNQFRGGTVLVNLTKELGDAKAAQSLIDTYTTDALMKMRTAVSERRDATGSLTAGLQFETHVYRPVPVPA